MPADTSPQTVSAFLNCSELCLKKGDIVLSRSPTFISWLIRKATGSSFSHAALVFLVREPGEGYENTFLLESTGKGVGIANLRHYISGRKPSAEIAIVRFKDTSLDHKFFNHVRGLMLDHVQAEYDYGIIARLTLSTLFGARLSFAKIQKGPKAAMQTAIERTRKRILKWLPPQFICSGFIQYGLVKAAVREGIDPSRVVLRKGLNAENASELLALTPDDISQSDKLRWLYVARRGWVYTVTDRVQAIQVISGGRL
jgi:Permuted papain-like amidase enzyme, YaeF/YiiX, C92 family